MSTKRDIRLRDDSRPPAGGRSQSPLNQMSHGVDGNRDRVANRSGERVLVVQWSCNRDRDDANFWRRRVARAQGQPTGVTERSINERLALQSVALGVIKHRPLSGVGAGNTPLAVQSSDADATPQPIHSLPLLFASSVLAGAGIAVGNVLVLGMVKRDFPTRSAMMTGLVTLAILAAPAADLSAQEAPILDYSVDASGRARIRVASSPDD